MTLVDPVSCCAQRAQEELREVDRMNARIEMEERRAREEVLDRIDKANAELVGIQRVGGRV